MKITISGAVNEDRGFKTGRLIARAGSTLQKPLQPSNATTSLLIAVVARSFSRPREVSPSTSTSITDTGPEFVDQSL